MSKNTNKAEGGSVKLSLFSGNKFSFPLKAMAAIGGIAAVTLGTTSAKEMIVGPMTTRVEQVQVADKATSDKLDKILDVVIETKNKVIENSTKIDAIEQRQNRTDSRVDKNERDIERVERKTD